MFTRDGVSQPADPDPVNSAEALREERAAVLESRKATQGTSPTDPFVGLALSGGGIRSATFCLGVLQAFAKCGEFTHIDYISSVSGGGYIASWLSAWISRKGIDEVSRSLNPTTVRTDDLIEAPEITWLRQYSNYLAPKLGMLSADSMTLVATWFRNVALNVVILVSFLACLFLLPRLLLDGVIQPMASASAWPGYLSFFLAFIVFPVGISYQIAKRPVTAQGHERELINGTWGVLIVVVIPGILVALFGSIALFSSELRTLRLFEIAGCGAVALVASGLSWALYQKLHGRLERGIGDGCVFLLAYVSGVVVGFVLIRAAGGYFVPVGGDSLMAAAALVSFGPPVILVIFGAVGSVIVGLVGKVYNEATREWWSRMNAWFLILGLIWLGWFALSFYAKPVVLWAHDLAGTWASAIGGASWIASLFSTLFARPAAPGDKGYAPLVRNFLLNVALFIVVLGMLAGVAIGVGASVEHLAKPAPDAAAQTAAAQHASRSPPGPVSLKFEVTATQGKPATVSKVSDSQTSKTFADGYLRDSFRKQFDAQRTCLNVTFDPHDRGVERCNGSWNIGVTGMLVAGCIAMLLLFGRRVDVNKFSLHNLYKNRLTRCYLGASRFEDRKPQPFTGFDEEDDLPLAQLHTAHVRPFHIINAALNITHGQNLAWQERKAASFALTPLHCGFVLGASTGDAPKAKDLTVESQPPKGSTTAKVGGYRPTSEWASGIDDERNFTLGMAMATSGAAVSSIQGKGSKPTLAFVMTVFNARLGRWSPNPLSRQGWRKSSPRIGLVYLLMELFGYANETSDFVYLSDGGHFDNTGIYELVRRRCKKIIAVDATADGERSMADLANVVRKCRVDFGAQIDFDLKSLGISRADQSSSEGFVFGSVVYREDENGERTTGTLVIIKPTLIQLKDLGVDVFGYSRQSDSFPHQSTVDQFFSESQFESYRELGERIATQCLSGSRQGVLVL